MPYLDNIITVVIPVYNSEKTLLHVISHIPEFVDNLIIVDDCSTDKSYNLIQDLPINHIRHSINKGYGGCQKTCYLEALKSNAEIIAMIHPDDQHNPRELENLIRHMIEGHYDLVIGTRFTNKYSPVIYGMPYYKYYGNLFLTKVVNLFLGTKLSDAHSGYRVFSRKLLLSLPFYKNANDFEFDAQIIIQAINSNYSISNSIVSVHYPQDCSSISFYNSLIYGVNTIKNLVLYKLHDWRIIKSNILTI